MYTGSQSEIVQVFLCTQLHRFTFRDSPGIFMYSQRKSRYIYYVQLHMFTVRDSPGIFMYTQLHRFTVRDSPGILMYTAAQVHIQG